MEVMNKRFQEMPTEKQLDDFFEPRFESYDVEVVVSSLSVRSQPDPDKTLVCIVRKGDKLSILEHGVSPDKQSWGRIKQGWINLKYVKNV